MIKRRGLFGLFLAAPAIVAAPSLMRVSTMPAGLTELSLSEIVVATLRANSSEIAANVAQHNALYARHFGFDVLNIPPEYTTADSFYVGNLIDG